MNLTNVMTEIAEAVGAIAGVRSYPFPRGKIAPPTFMTTLPQEIIPHNTYANGMSTIRMPALFCVALLQDRTAVQKLASYLNMAGPLSIVRAIEDHDYVSCDVVTVASVAADKVITVARTDYLGAEFTLDIGGSGSE